MPLNIVWPTAQDEEVVDAIRDAIGRDITWYIVASSIPCSACNLDPITNTSTDSFCVVCGGDYWIPTYSGIITNAHINWGFQDQLGWVSGGQLNEGECRVQIKYTQANLDAINNSRWVEVDGKIMQVIKPILRGVKTINRILVDLKERMEEY